MIELPHEFMYQSFWNYGNLQRITRFTTLRVFGVTNMGPVRETISKVLSPAPSSYYVPRVSKF